MIFNIDLRKEGFEFYNLSYVTFCWVIFVFVFCSIYTRKFLTSSLPAFNFRPGVRFTFIVFFSLFFEGIKDDKF